MKWAGRWPEPLTLLVEGVTQFKKKRFCASLGHHKSNT